MGDIVGMVNFKDFVRKDRDSFTHTIDSLPTVGSVREWYSTYVALGYKGMSENQLVQKKSNGNMYTIVFSGYVNQAEEVKEELLNLGYPMSTSSDAELVVTAYIKWGEEILNDFSGSFSFAIWDDEIQQIILHCHDKKKLYYCIDLSILRFTSQKSSIFIPSIQTPLVNPKVQELLPGQTLQFSKDALYVKELSK